MGLFGPSQQQMTHAVRDGIRQAISTTYSTHWNLKIGEMKIRGQYAIVPIQGTEISLEPYDSSKVPNLVTVKVLKDVNDLIFDVVEERHQLVSNPFTGEQSSSIISSRDVGRFYQHRGWERREVLQLIHFAYKYGHFISDENEARWLIENGKI